MRAGWCRVKLQRPGELGTGVWLGPDSSSQAPPKKLIDFAPNWATRGLNGSEKQFLHKKWIWERCAAGTFRDPERIDSTKRKVLTWSDPDPRSGILK
jgi:hypothetical protein